MVTSGTTRQKPVQVHVTMQSGRQKRLQYDGTVVLFANADIAKQVLGTEDVWEAMIAETFPGETVAEASYVELVEVEPTPVGAP